MYDPASKKSIVLAQKEDRVQFLKAGNQVVLRMFSDQNLKASDSKFSRYISLNRLEEVSSVSSDFKPIVLNDMAQNNHAKKLGTYTIVDIEEVFWNMQVYKTLIPLF